MDKGDISLDCGYLMIKGFSITNEASLSDEEYEDYVKWMQSKRHENNTQ